MLDCTHLNFFKGFEYDPTPELEAMVMVVLSRGRGELRGVEIKNARRRRTDTSSRNRVADHTRRVQ